MNLSRKRRFGSIKELGKRSVAALLAAALLVASFPPAGATAQTPATRPVPHPAARPANPAFATDSIAPLAALPDSIPLAAPLNGPAEVVEDEVQSVDGKLIATPVDTVDIRTNRPVVRQQRPDELIIDGDTITLTAGETLAIDSLLLKAAEIQKEDEWVPRDVEFSPDPTKAVWMSALFPGLGQVYNRRYWKLPLVVGGYLGLAYATNWNNNMLHDYTIAYSDLLDNDPETRSYMNFFSPNVKEESLDRSWLQNVLNSRKNYFRRNRDLCIICMVGIYFLAMVDAYVDASLSHFDISPDLSMDVAPALIQDGRQRYPSVGLVWALNF